MRCVFGAHRLPIDAVEIRIVKIIAQVRPCLVEDLELLAREVDIHLCGDRERARSAALERHYIDATLFEIKNFFAVGRELSVAFETSGGGQLPRDRGLSRKLI